MLQLCSALLLTVLGTAHDAYVPSPKMLWDAANARQCKTLPLQENNVTDKASFEKAVLHELGSTLQIGFLGGTSDQHATFERVIMREIQPLVNLKLRFDTDRNSCSDHPGYTRTCPSFVKQGLCSKKRYQAFMEQYCAKSCKKCQASSSSEADIRVSFDPDLGSWSQVGTKYQGVKKNKATMNIGWEGEDVIMHEFCHALGMHHEHQSPKSTIEWDVDEVVKSLSGPPNNWNRAQIETNVLGRLDADLFRASEFDKDSIMLYAFPVEWTTCKCIGDTNNKVMSATDKAWLRKVYPREDQPPTPTAPPTPQPPQPQPDCNQRQKTAMARFTKSTENGYWHSSDKKCSEEITTAMTLEDCAQSCLDTGVQCGGWALEQVSPGSACHIFPWASSARNANCDWNAEEKFKHYTRKDD